MPMGITSENVAEKYGITREMQDEFAVESQRKAAEAQKRGFYKHEIVPVQARTSAEGEPDTWTEVSADDGVRAGVTMEKLAKLAPAFKEGGTTTAGSSSQVTDGASAMLVMSRRKAQELGLKPIAKFVQSVVVGVPAALMGMSPRYVANVGVAPAYAVPELLEKVGLDKDDIDVYELNEGMIDKGVPNGSFCISVCVLCQPHWTGSQKSQPQRWCNRNWTYFYSRCS
jgi:acetyl-CoA acyltransferase 1